MTLLERYNRRFVEPIAKLETIEVVVVHLSPCLSVSSCASGISAR